MNPGTHLLREWASEPVRTLWEREKSFTTARIQTPNHPSCSLISVYKICAPSPQTTSVGNKLISLYAMKLPFTYYISGIILNAVCDIVLAKYCPLFILLYLPIAVKDFSFGWYDFNDDLY
jgi:hypothetical protein